MLLWFACKRIKLKKSFHTKANCMSCPYVVSTETTSTKSTTSTTSTTTVTTTTTTTVEPEEATTEVEKAEAEASVRTSKMSLLPLYVAVPLIIVAAITIAVLVIHRVHGRKNRVGSNYVDVTASKFDLDDDDREANRMRQDSVFP